MGYFTPLEEGNIQKCFTSTSGEKISDAQTRFPKCQSSIREENSSDRNIKPFLGAPPPAEEQFFFKLLIYIGYKALDRASRPGSPMGVSKKIILLEGNLLHSLNLDLLNLNKY